MLENGAYSDSNESKQLAKGSNVYNNNEKLIVELSWKYRKFLGLKIQKQIINILKEDNEFLLFLKDIDNKLYGEVLQVVNNAKERSAR